jgi:hypothetical protein
MSNYKCNHPIITAFKTNHVAEKANMRQQAIYGSGGGYKHSGMMLNPYAGVQTVYVFEQKGCAEDKKEKKQSWTDIATGIATLAESGCKGTAAILNAIAETSGDDTEVSKSSKSKGTSGGTSTPSSDAPTYSSASSATSGRASNITGKEASEKAKTTSGDVSKAITEYKKTNDSKSLESAVRSAIGERTVNLQAIGSEDPPSGLKGEIALSKKELGESEAKLKAFQDGTGEFAETGVAPLKKKAEDAQETMTKTQSANNEAISNLREEATTLGNEISGLQSLKNSKPPESDTEKYAAWEQKVQEEYGITPDKIDETIKQKEERKNLIEGEGDSETKGIKALEAENKQVQLDRDAAAKAYKQAQDDEKNVYQAAVNTARSEARSTESRCKGEISKLESANKKLDNAIKDGNKALGALAINE